ncbi:MAG: adenylate/guanylate cyclase domain-containing protein [Minicystis sp.]
MDLDLEKLSLTEIIRLQNRLSEVLRRRFTTTLSLCFTDIVGSTAYFARFGDEAGRRMQQRHFDLLDRAFLPRGGRVVDTAGDGAFSVFPSVESGAGALVDFFRLLYDDNAAHAREDEIQVRAGMHWGEVLADGDVVSGESVNLCSRVAQTGGAMEIRLTREAFRELPNALKLRCLRLLPQPLKGIPGVVEILVLGWQDRSLFPVAVRIEETGAEIPLPPQDTIAFGRLADDALGPGNDVVITAADPAATQGISRYHFELRRKADGFVLRSLTARLTEVDGHEIPRGGEARIGPESVVRVARVLTLRFVGAAAGDDAGLSTLQTL